MFRTIDRYEDTSLGLPYPVVLFDSAEEEIDDATGERIGISVPHVEGLVAAIAVARALCPIQLEGAEVKFVRRAIGLSGKDFAEGLGLDPATLSRWENGKQEVGAWADKQVRMAAVISLGDHVPALKLDQKAIVSLVIRPRLPGETLLPEVRLVSVESGPGDGDVEAWELKLAA